MESRSRIRENLELQKQDQMKKLKEEKKMIDFEVKKLEFMNLPKLELDYSHSGFVLTFLASFGSSMGLGSSYFLGRAWDFYLRDVL